MTTVANEAVKVRPVFEGPIQVDGNSWSRRLTGGRCRECGTVTFTLRTVCPACWQSNTQETVELSDHGKLYSYTIVRNPPAGTPGPYAIAYVDLPEKLRLMVRADADIGRIAIGSDVTIEVVPIGTDEDGTIVVGPALRTEGRNGAAA